MSARPVPRTAAHATGVEWPPRSAASHCTPVALLSPAGRHGAPPTHQPVSRLPPSGPILTGTIPAAHIKQSRFDLVPPRHHPRTTTAVPQVRTVPATRRLPPGTSCRQSLPVSWHRHLRLDPSAIPSPPTPPRSASSSQPGERSANHNDASREPRGPPARTFCTISKFCNCRPGMAHRRGDIF